MEDLDQPAKSAKNQQTEQGMPLFVFAFYYIKSLLVAIVLFNVFCFFFFFFSFSLYFFQKTDQRKYKETDY